MALSASFGDLKTRVISASLLGLISLALLWPGGVFTATLLSIGVVVMVREWRRMALQDSAMTSLPMLVSMVFGVLTVFMTELMGLPAGLLMLCGGAALLAVLDRAGARWGVPGFLYITFSMTCIDVLRADAAYGLLSVLWLILVVIAADVGGYFFGRVFGGPKLWPRVSPKKTWSGLLGGVLLAAGIGLIFSAITPGIVTGVITAVSGLVAIASVGGDLLESSLKRHFGVKDSGTILPGHGGALDRFDGLMAAALVVGIITILRDRPLFIWW